MATDFDTTPEVDNLRDTLDAAFEQHATDETPEAKPEANTEAPAPAPAEDGRARDESGRFAPKAKEDTQEAAQAPAAPAPGPVVQTDPNAAQAPAVPEKKAPASWSPLAREKWATTAPEIQAEVHRREGEMQQVLQRTAQHRQFVEAFENVVRPYEVFIRQENSNPLQAVQNLMQTAADLRVGSPQHKAQTVANIIKQYGVDLETLDSLLAGAPLPQGQPAAYRDPRVDQLLQQQQQFQQQQQRQELAGIHQQLNSFASSHEFYGDVQGMMADILEINARQGRAIDLEAAYKQACQMTPQVSTILAQRHSTAATPAKSQAVLRARRAASSLRNEATPHSGATVPKNDSVRASIEAAFEQLSDS